MSTLIVIPAYNEEKRLNCEAFIDFVQKNPVDLLFVNDGSRDGTEAILQKMALEPRIHVLSLEKNSGKGEAVRRGLCYGIEKGYYAVGYWDADLATPLEVISDFVALLKADPSLQIITGARVKMVGRTIERNAARHYMGRIFATLVTLVLGLPIYDSQCGAKLMRVSPELQQALSVPFLSRWIFDLEIILRLLDAGQGWQLNTILKEYPLQRWIHVGGSKIGPKDFVRALSDLARLRSNYGNYTVS